MGNHPNLTADKYPKQGGWIGHRVSVCFHYDVIHHHDGTILRDDLEEPFRTVIRLDDGRIVLGSECQYQPTGDLLGSDPMRGLALTAEGLLKLYGDHIEELRQARGRMRSPRKIRMYQWQDLRSYLEKARRALGDAYRSK